MIIELNQLTRNIAQLKSQPTQTIVLATGVFDLLHFEHINFLSKAKAVGDILIVGIESDFRVKQIKGNLRPIESETKRLQNVANLPVVDFAFLLPHSFSSQSAWEQLIIDLSPDIYAVSSHTSFLENKQRICDQHGVQLKIVHNFNPQISTTIKINQKKVQ